MFLEFSKANNTSQESIFEEYYIVSIKMINFYQILFVYLWNRQMTWLKSHLGDVWGF